MRKNILLTFISFFLFLFLFIFVQKSVFAACDPAICTGQTACSLNGSSCATQGRTCSNSTTTCGGAANTPCCVSEWALGSGCAASACATPAPTPTPAPTCGPNTCPCGATCNSLGQITCTVCPATPTPVPTATPGGGGGGTLICNCIPQGQCGSCSSQQVTGSCASNNMQRSCPNCSGGGGCNPTTSCANQGVTCGSIFNGCSTVSCGPACPTPTPIPTPTPAPTYTISGNVFVDINGNGVKDGTEANYSGSITITSTRGSVTYGSGTYTISGVSAGSDTVSYTSLPSGSGYKMTKPVNGPPAFYTVALGGSCSPDGSSGTCTLGNLSGVNFGITNVPDPWIQSTGGNIRLDSGINNNIPVNASAQCGGSFMDLPGNGGIPGVIYSGNNSATFGSGQASSTNWVVKAPDGQGYTPPTPNTIRTSYNYIYSNASQQGVTINDLSPKCGGNLSNCSLPLDGANFPSGVYLSDGPLTLTGNYTFPTNKNYIILVHGNVFLNGETHVPVGSTAIISSSLNITVGTNVGVAVGNYTSPTANLEGVFSADNNFIVDGINSCISGTDRRLNIAGNVIPNAALSGGSFVNRRNLCTGNVCPSISFTQRLDMIINLPRLVKVPNYIWREVAP